MRSYKLADKMSKAAMLMLLAFVLTACWPIKPDAPVILNESKVQKMQKGESANFDGWLLTDGAFVKLLEKAERICK